MRTQSMIACLCLCLLSHFTYADVISTFDLNHGGDREGNCLENYLNHYGFSGGIGLPNSTEYNASVAIDNKRVAVNPIYSLSPANEFDVSLAVLAAEHCRLPFAVKSGGHSAAGYCLSTGIVINLAINLNNVELKPDNKVGGVVSIQAGATWSKVYTITNTTEYLPVGGGCPTVGSGFLLGGGWSFLSRSYGLGCDNILSARLVLANGTAVTVSDTEHSDLFWAVRGGGGGNFGIATSFELQMHRPRSATMLVGQLCWNPFDPVVLDLWTYWLDDYWHNAPDYFDIEPSFLPLNNEPNVTDSRMFCFTVICNGDPTSECGPLVDNIVTTYPPVINSVLDQPFMAWQMNNGNVTDAQEGYLYLTSGILAPGAFTVTYASLLIEALRAAPSKRNLVLFHTGGGKIRSVDTNATAFPWRNVELIIQLKGIWDEPEQEEENVKWVKSTRAIVEPVLSGSYINYIDPYLSDWQKAYYGTNYPRLLTMKHQVDPKGVFSFNQSIGQ